MGSLRAQVAWLLTGAARAAEAQRAQDEAIRELQSKVDDLANRLARLDPVVGDLAEQSSALPAEMRTAIDDLGSRIGSINERLERSDG